MDVETQIKEVDISCDHWPKLRKIEDSWIKEKTIVIVNIIKEYQDVFVRDYKDLKGLVQEMDKMKIELLPNANLVKKRDPTNLWTNINT